MSKNTYNQNKYIWSRWNKYVEDDINIHKIKHWTECFNVLNLLKNKIKHM